MIIETAHSHNGYNKINLFVYHNVLLHFMNLIYTVCLNVREYLDFQMQITQFVYLHAQALRQFLETESSVYYKIAPTLQFLLKLFVCLYANQDYMYKLLANHNLVCQAARIICTHPFQMVLIPRTCVVYVQNMPIYKLEGVFNVKTHAVRFLL